MDVTVGRSRINRSLFADALVLLAFFAQGLQHTLDWFAVARLTVILPNLDINKRNKDIDTRIDKENAILREIYHSVVTKSNFQTPQSSFWTVCVPITTMFMDLG